MTPVPPSKPRVLFVDDEPAVMRALSLAVRKEPYEIRTAVSGHAALELFAEAPFDVIVSDERMPGMSGSDLLSQVRERYPSTVRIILSGQATLEAAVRAINGAEIYRFLMKPCPAEEIAVTIREALARRDERLRFEEWSAAQSRRTPEDLTLGFERALAALWIGFQPVLYAKDATTFAYEALVRSDDPDMRTPSALFAAARELGRTVELGTLIRAAVAARIPEAPPGALILVNVNPEDLADPALVSGDEPLGAYARRVVLEITERESIHVGLDVEAKVKSLRTLGYRIAVDDLGAGYAGLTTFALLTPEFVKFDMDLIRSIDKSPTKQKLVSSMVKLSHELGILTVAEGVETPEERDLVVSLGCDFVQGFLFGAAARGFGVELGKLAA
jgi:EAL domain-containing protein (putative c-di-GMP-specific phosphodiesterase class I)